MRRGGVRPFVENLQGASGGGGGISSVTINTTSPMTGGDVGDTFTLDIGDAQALSRGLMSAAHYLAVQALPSSYRGGSHLFGLGLDGAVTLNGGGTVSATSNYYPSSLDVSNSTSFAVNNWLVLVNGTTSVESGSAIHNDGNNGAAAGTAGASKAAGAIGQATAAGGAGGTAAGTASGNLTGQCGGRGGAGGAGSGGAGGAAGTRTVMPILRGGEFCYQFLPLAMLNQGFYSAGTAGLQIHHGGGGGGGGGDGTAGGGGGGGAGGVYLATTSLFNGGRISANGGAGGSPAAGNRGGGGGGGGGVLTIVTRSLSGSGTLEANGGAGGTPSGTGVAGSNGNAGHTDGIHYV
jgi:hypothetical protein